jgi:hypothetical protein
VNAKGQKATNFICIPNKLEGKVLVHKIEELKIPKRSIGKLLAEGKLVLENGTQVAADQIKLKDDPSPNLLILHYTSVESIGQIAAHPKFQAYINNSENVT